MYNNNGLPPMYSETNPSGEVAVMLAGSTSFAPPVIYQVPPQQPSYAPSVMYQNPPQQQPSYAPPVIIQVPPQQRQNTVFVGVNSPKKNSWLAWSIVNLILFFPLLIFWIPALICSIMARDSNR